jgi:hypothetical protein
MKLSLIVAIVFVGFLILGSTVAPIFANLGVLVLGIYLIYCFAKFFVNVFKKKRE